LCQLEKTGQAGSTRLLDRYDRCRYNAPMQPEAVLPAAAKAITILYLLFAGGICFFGVLLLAFWIWMLFDCITNEPPGGDKIVWLCILICLFWAGAIVYFFARRRNRSKGQFFKPEAPPPIR
jgi:sterol desaturase/sphingolipid hydroxylase (fatty acid hydroxylase superfamily)